MSNNIDNIYESIVSLVEKGKDEYDFFLEDKWKRLSMTEFWSDLSVVNESAWSSLKKENKQHEVALVGVVNAGKSSLGNALLGLREEQCFKEGVTRETSEAQIESLSEDLLLVDMPGLGSVIKSDDDISKDGLYRASVVVLVIAINAPINQHLYDFIQNNILRDKRLQRLIIVLTKTDQWDFLTQNEKQREHEKYQNFLFNGDESLGFSGISELFDYEVPCVSVSSVEYRRSGDNSEINLLMDLINYASEQCPDGNKLRYFLQIRSEISSLRTLSISSFNEASRIANQEQSDEDNFTQWVTDVLLQSHHETMGIIAEKVGVFMRSLKNYEPDGFFECAFETSSFKNKRNRCKSMRNDCIDYCIEMHSENVLNTLNLINSALEEKYETEKSIGITDNIEHLLKKLYKNVTSHINNIWDYYDDIFFTNTRRSVDSINESINKESIKIDNKNIKYLSEIEKNILIYIDKCSDGNMKNNVLPIMDSLSDSLISINDAINDIFVENVK